MERVIIFIDSSNFYHGLKECIGRVDINFEKFGRKLCGKNRKFLRIYYYNVPAIKEYDEEKYKSQQKFFESLRRKNYITVKLGRLEKRGDTAVEKGVDIKISVDMIRLAYNNAYDTAIIVTGDGDFADAVDLVKDLGKNVENAYLEERLSYHLTQSCDRTIRLNERYLRECFKK